MKNNILIIGLIGISLIGCDKIAPNGNAKKDVQKIEKTQSAPVVIANEKTERQANTKDKAPLRPSLSDNTIRSTLVGTWVLLGDDCQSGNGLIFADAGKYASETEEGDWSLESQNLKIRAISHEGETGLHPINWNVKILDIDENTAILQRDDGSNMQWSRCKSVPKL